MSTGEGRALRCCGILCLDNGNVIGWHESWSKLSSLYLHEHPSSISMIKITDIESQRPSHICPELFRIFTSYADNVETL